MINGAFFSIELQGVTLVRWLMRALLRIK